MSAHPKETWLPTSKAAKALVISPYTLRRRGWPGTGFLREGVHCKRGMKASHPHGWNMELCTAELESQGFLLTNRSD